MVFVSTHRAQLKTGLRCVAVKQTSSNKIAENEIRLNAVRPVRCRRSHHTGTGNLRWVHRTLVSGDFLF